MADTLESLEIEVVHHSAGAGTAIGAVTKAVNNLSGALTKALPNLKEFGDSLGKIGAAFTFNDNRGSTFNKTIQNVKQTASKAATETAKVTEPMGEGMQMLISGATKYAVELNKAADAEVKMNEAFKSGDSQAAWRAREQMINATARAEKEYAKMHPVEEAAPTAVPLGQQNFIANANAIDLLKMKLEGLNAAMQKAFGEGDAQKAAQFRQQILQTEAALEKAQKAAEGAGKATKEAANGVKHLAKESSKAKSPLENFISSLKRIAFYRIIRSIIKSITQAFQEGLQNAYAFSQGITTEGHRFAEAMDSMKTAGTTMKNQLGSAFIGLLTALAPIINAIISLITKLANALSQLFAIFTGGTYLKAADVPQKWAEAAGGAGKAAKEWKNQLMGFDEINRLDEPNNGGGGGGGGAADVMEMFKDTPIDGIFKKIRDKLIELKNELDFTKLRESWEHLKESVAGFADIIERRVGFVWETYLKPLAHWTIEEGLPLVIENIASALDLVRTILEKLEPYMETFEQEIVVPLMEWDLDRVTRGLEGVNTVLDELTKLVNGDIDFGTFISNIDLSINDIINWANPLRAVFQEIGYFFHDELNALWEETKNSFNDLKETVTTVIDKVKKKFEEMKEKAYEKFEPIITKVTDVYNAIHDKLIGGFESARDTISGVMSELSSWFDSTFGGLISWCQRAHAWLQDIIDGLGHIGGGGGFLGGLFGGGVQTRASGGFVDEGQLFIAREAGAEMVGTIGGHTAVANNDQIVEGIRQGVFEAVMAANSNGNNDVNVKVYLDSREIKNGQSRLNRSLGVA